MYEIHVYNPRGFQSKKEYGYYILLLKYTSAQKKTALLKMGNPLPNDLQLTDKMMMSVIIRSNHSNYHLPADTQTIWFTVNIFSSAIARSFLKQEGRQTTSIGNKCSCWRVEFRDVWEGRISLHVCAKPSQRTDDNQGCNQKVFPLCSDRNSC